MEIESLFSIVKKVVKDIKISWKIKEDSCVLR